MPSTVDWTAVDLACLDAPEGRLDDQRLAAVDLIARLPVPILPRADEDFFLKCMRALRLLPGRTDDDIAGGLRLNLYRRHFGHLSRDALAYLTDRATATCRWFPTPAELFEILKGWERSDPEFLAIRRARRLAREEWQARLDETMRRFERKEMTQREVDALPALWQDIAVTRGYVWPGTLELRSSFKPAAND